MKMNKNLIIMFLGISCLSSCVIDVIRSYRIKNCTNDTLFIQLKYDTLKNEVYWGQIRLYNTAELVPEDTTAVFEDGEKVYVPKFYELLPDSLTENIRQIDLDSFYMYVLSKQMATHYSEEEIRTKKLYDKRTVTKKDIRDGILEYRYPDLGKDN